MMIGRKPFLTPEQAAEVRRRHALWRENMPQRIAQDMGISTGCLRWYLNERHKRRELRRTDGSSEGRT